MDNAKIFLRFLKDEGIFIRFKKRFYSKEFGVNDRKKMHEIGVVPIDLSSCDLYKYLKETKPLSYIKEAFQWDNNASNIDYFIDDEFLYWGLISEIWSKRYFKINKKYDTNISAFLER